jgi:hypothetical protein
MGTIAASPLNRYSFLRFSEGTGFTVGSGNVTSPVVVTQNYTDYFNPFRLVGYRDYYSYLTPIIHGDGDSFFTVTLETGTFSSSTVIVFNESTGAAIQGASATATLFNGNKSVFLKISYSGTASDLPVVGRLLIGSNKVSNRFSFAKKTTELLYSAPRIEYSGLTNWYDFSYDNTVTLGAYTGRPFNKLRILASQVVNDYPNNSTEYRNDTDNKVRILKQLIDKKIELETYQFDDYAHEAMVIALAHSTFKLNDLKYILADGESYAPNATKDMKISNGTVMLLEDRFTRKNKPCPTIDES